MGRKVLVLVLGLSFLAFLFTGATYAQVNPPNTKLQFAEVKKSVLLGSPDGTDKMKWTFRLFPLKKGRVCYETLFSINSANSGGLYNTHVNVHGELCGVPNGGLVYFETWANNQPRTSISDPSWPVFDHSKKAWTVWTEKKQALADFATMLRNYGSDCWQCRYPKQQFSDRTIRIYIRDAYDFTRFEGDKRLLFMSFLAFIYAYEDIFATPVLFSAKDGDYLVYPSRFKEAGKDRGLRRVVFMPREDNAELVLTEKVFVALRLK